jgi:hypothetical protein
MKMQDEIPKYRKKRPKNKPYFILARVLNIEPLRDWFVFKRYTTKVQRDQAFKVLCSKDSLFEYKIEE